MEYRQVDFPSIITREAQDLVSSLKTVIGFFTEEDTTEKTEPITIPVTKIRLKYYIDETTDGIVYRPVWSFCCPYQWKDSPEEQELFYIDGETGALIRDAFGW